MRKANAHILAASVALGMSGLGAGNQTAPILELTPYTKSRPKKKRRKSKEEKEEGAIRMNAANEKRGRKNRKQIRDQMRCDSGYYAAQGRLM